MSTRSKSYGAKMLFWYLRLFFTMGFSAAATATLWYQFINKLFPLQVTLYAGGVNRPYDTRAVIWAISSLVILAPTYGVRNFYKRDARMPESLEELHEEGYVHKRAMEDPKTGDVYAYRIVNEEEFEICATFATDNREDDEGDSRAYRPTGPYGRSFRHGAEHTCFTQKASEP